MTHVIVFNALLLIACGYAFLMGGAPERWTALVFVGSAFATFLAPFYDSLRPFRHVEPALLLVDLIMLAIHGVKAIQPSLVPWMYAGASGKIAYPMLLMLAIGALRHRQRKAQFGSDRDWSPLRQPDIPSS